MPKIDQKFKQLLSAGEPALMTHTVIGYPDLTTCEELVIGMSEAGADFIELQIPFSDPLADGPVIMDACQKALAEQHVKVKDAIELMARLTKQIDTPLLFMSYYNILYNYGVKKFCKDASEAGCAGLIIPDIPIEESKEYLLECSKNKMDPIFVVSPVTPEDRLKKIGAKAKGFLYCMGRTGVTGKSTKFGTDFKNYMERVKRYTNLPVGVGFGVKSHDDYCKIAEHAEMTIVGTALIEAYKKGGKSEVIRFVKSLKKG